MLILSFISASPSFFDPIQSNPIQLLTDDFKFNLQAFMSLSEQNQRSSSPPNAPFSPGLSSPSSSAPQLPLCLILATRLRLHPLGLLLSLRVWLSCTAWSFTYGGRVRLESGERPTTMIDGVRVFYVSGCFLPFLLILFFGCLGKDWFMVQKYGVSVFISICYSYFNMISTFPSS